MPAERTSSDPTPDPQPRPTRLTFKKTAVKTPRTLTHKEVLFHTLPAAIRARHRGDYRSFWRETDTGPRTHIPPPSPASPQTKRRPHHLPAPIFIRENTTYSTKPTALVKSSTNQRTTNTPNLGTTSNSTEKSTTSTGQNTRRHKDV